MVTGFVRLEHAKSLRQSMARESDFTRHAPERFASDKTSPALHSINETEPRVMHVCMRAFRLSDTEKRPDYAILPRGEKPTRYQKENHGWKPPQDMQNGDTGNDETT